MAYQQFGPVVTLVPRAVRAARRFDVDPSVLVGVLLIEGEGRQRFGEVSEEWERLQIQLGQPDPSIGVMQMKLSVFKETTLRHLDTFQLPPGASSESGWREAFLHRLQNEGTAIRYAAAHLQDLMREMRPQDRQNPSLLAATYNAGISGYRQLYVHKGFFGPRAETYRQSFTNLLPWINDILD
jgi:hypothetical protein